MKKNSPYYKCPRCELNYIPKEENLCDVCKAELKLIQGNPLLLDDEDEILCPVCKQNYISIDDDMCLKCSERIGEKESFVTQHDDGEEWDAFDEDKAVGVDDDIDVVSLTELEEEEKNKIFEDEEEFVDNSDDFIEEDDFEEADLEDIDLDEDEDEDEEDDED